MKKRSWFILPLLLLSLSCGLVDRVTPEVAPVISTATPTPLAGFPTLADATPTQTEAAPATADDVQLPEKTDGEQVMLWAEAASVSSAAGEEAYHADQALFEPNTLACGDYVTAWQPSDDALEATLELNFSPPILPAEVHVAQSFQPGGITRVAVVTLDEAVITLYDAAEEAYPPSPDCPLTNVFWAPDVTDLITQVQITVARKTSDPWTQIDAVGVWGWVSEPLAQEDALPEPPEEEDFYAPTYFTNKNQITSLAFADGQLWAGSKGGVVAWDLESGIPTTYTVAEGLPGNGITALTICQPPEGARVMVGSRSGLASITLDGVPFFTPLDLPEEDFSGQVTALGCDDARGHLWVGYTGQLSRYDFASGKWLTFTSADGLPGDTVRSIRVINGEVWVATAMGAARLREGEGLETFTPDDSGIPSGFIHGIGGDEASRLWMASSDGLVGYDPYDGSWSLTPAGEIPDSTLANGLLALVPGGDGTLWLADFFGSLCQFNPGWQTCSQALTPPEDVFSFSALAVGDGGKVAVGGLNSGVQVFDDGAWTTLHTTDPAVDNGYRAAAFTPDGRLWLAGITTLQSFRADRPDLPWETLALPDDGQAHSFYVASDGLWIGHTGGALFLPYLPAEAEIQLPMGDPAEAIANTVTAITVDDDGRVYFGTTSGVSIWDGEGFVYADLLSEAERDRGVYPPQVHALHNEGEAVWVGAENGLHKFEAGSYRSSWTESLAAASSYSSRSVGVIVPALDGCRFWVGVGRDLMCFTGLDVEVLLTLPSAIRSLYVHPNLLWLATAHAGLYSVPVDSSGVVWDLVAGGDDFAIEFSTQSIVMSDAHTVWFAGMEGGLARQRGLWGQ